MYGLVLKCAQDSSEGIVGSYEAVSNILCTYLIYEWVGNVKPIMGITYIDMDFTCASIFCFILGLPSSYVLCRSLKIHDTYIYLIL